ncbi:hypothetical protein Agabi119p4_2818 [Agaricus bisporus var. burnettii]|uniref:WD40 repeat-like protein n=1 Tax=Agaricus bisporus var. burnettii TaxID=192524 RepID=A0A8H7F630_AGABI|nr:hypothetical protein Agabi119p4_2818 [Agaricus bisporus var. burnettii]
MFSVIAADALAIADSPTLRSSPSHLPSRLHPTDEYRASAWATDNSVLYLASAQIISRYNPSSNQLQTLHTLEDGHTIRCVAASDPTTVAFGAGAQVYILECDTSPPEVVQTLGPFHHDVLTLSLSNDSTLLACGLSNAVHIHNFSTGSQTTLRGLPSSHASSICVFHSHIRTRLLVGFYDQLFIYETTRPSAPLKIITMNEAGGSIAALACSPFSKTLVAVAMTSGVVALVDMDKEKGIFRMIDLKVSPTTIGFSPEGASIYVGTENGKLLVQDLRALDKPPKSFIVSELGHSIDTLAVQKKLKSLPSDIKGKGTPRTLAKKLADNSAFKSTPSPLRSRTAQASSTISATPTRRVSLKGGTPKRASLTKATIPKNVLSPARDPHRNSMSFDPNGAATKVKKIASLTSVSPKKSRSNSARTALATQVARRSMTSNPVRPRTSSIASTVEVAEISTVPQLDFPSISTSRPPERPRSNLSIIASDSVSTFRSRSSRTRATSSLSSQKQSSAPSIPPVSTGAVSDLRSSVLRSSLAKLAEEDRTPSPDLPGIETQSITPMPLQKKKALAMLGLGTPEVTEWIKAGKGKSRDTQGTKRVKSVGFTEDNESREETDDESGASEAAEDDKRERERTLSMQVTPRRPSSSQTQSHGPGKQQWDASPLFRQPRHPAHVSGTPTTGNAHELLKSIMKDVMYEYQMENKAELMGMHLDLVKMGRGWKQELRVLMEEYVGDLNDLREENKRLREENVRLKRGY